MKYVWHVIDVGLAGAPQALETILNGLAEDGWEVVNYLPWEDLNTGQKRCKLVCRKSVSPDVRAMCHAEVR